MGTRQSQGQQLDAQHDHAAPDSADRAAPEEVNVGQIERWRQLFFVLTGINPKYDGILVEYWQVKHGLPPTGKIRRREIEIAQAEGAAAPDARPNPEQQELQRQREQQVGRLHSLVQGTPNEEIRAPGFWEELKHGRGGRVFQLLDKVTHAMGAGIKEHATRAHAMEEDARDRSIPMMPGAAGVVVGGQMTWEAMNREITATKEAIVRALEAETLGGKAKAAGAAVLHLAAAGLGAYTFAEPLGAVTEGGSAAGGGMAVALAGEPGGAVAATGATPAVGVNVAGMAATGVASQLHSQGDDYEGGTRDDQSAASIKRLGRSGQDKQLLKQSLKKIQHEREHVIEELTQLHDELPSIGISAIRSSDIAMRLRATVRAVKEHLTDSDITGAMRDLADDPVRQVGSGQAFNHLQEVNDALASLTRTRTELARIKADMVRRQMDPKLIADKLGPALDAITATIQSVRQALSNVKP